MHSTGDEAGAAVPLQWCCQCIAHMCRSVVLSPTIHVCRALAFWVGPSTVSLNTSKVLLLLTALR
jgi:hypothetical protein